MDELEISIQTMVLAFTNNRGSKQWADRYIAPIDDNKIDNIGDGFMQSHRKIYYSEIMKDLAYIKFASDDLPIYEPINLGLFSERFEEFMTIRDMTKDLEMEYYNEHMIVSYQPISMLSAFKNLKKICDFADESEFVTIESIEEEIKLLELLCKWGNKEQIEHIMNFIIFEEELWVTLLDKNFDAKNYFSEERNLNICKIIYENHPELNEETYLHFYGFAWFDNSPKYLINSSHNVGLPKRRVRNKMTKDCYDVVGIGKKVILLNRQKFQPLPEVKSLFDTDDFTSMHFSCSEDSSSSDEENITTVNFRAIKLSKELINGQKINNFIIDVVKVHFAYNIVDMQLIETTNLSRNSVNVTYKSKSTGLVSRNYGHRVD
uniref:Uncharacterized protein n=1 Tax=viral metagenome TaxID=1070528 RepID=A0A6C0C7X6_9ZZZZ